MRDFSWKYFTMTGDVDAYLLYREAGQNVVNQELREDEPQEDEDWDELNFMT